MDFKNRGKSVILVSHEMNTIHKYCDRALFLKDGKVDKIGTPDEAIASYVDFLDKSKLI